ncbi:MAG: polyphosphate kinase 1 [Chitinophagaceae bacterium]
MQNYSFFDRDLSWLSFNGRVLQEAAKENVPLLERMRFLSIYSSNLDEFYRVRMPAVMALQHIALRKKKEGEANANAALLQEVAAMVQNQQEQFGRILTQQLIPALKQNNIHIVYNEPAPEAALQQLYDYYVTQVLAFLQPVHLDKTPGSFFPLNNKLYLAVELLDNRNEESVVIINIPADDLPRFYKIADGDTQYIFFLDDIIKWNLNYLFPGKGIAGAYTFKITRDAELDLKDEYEGDIAEKIEKQIAKRDFGLATRFLYEPSMPLRTLQTLINELKLESAGVVEGGVYHNLKDLDALPVNNNAWRYPSQPSLKKAIVPGSSLFEEIRQKDLIVHPPYQSYDTILRFFNEAATSNAVEEIYVMLYRVANDSKIVHALMSAARNGKKVTVLVELKARFDEANNLKWARKMKDAGVTIIYSIPGLKVHAKIALVKKRVGKRMEYYGMLATGNLNESTARFYTDHILLTGHHEITREMELLFIFLGRRKKPVSPEQVPFRHLLVAQFNMQQRFLELIDREIENAKKGLASGITIKLNNIEERVLISKLYEASQAGVPIKLIVRSICCIIPAVEGMSDNITIRRIVDRYLEHGRIFLFHNNGGDELFMGSSDWMNRSMYRRIEVAFPVYDVSIKDEIKNILALQWQDNQQAVILDRDMQNIAVAETDEPVRSQQAIYEWLSAR